MWILRSKKPRKFILRNKGLTSFPDSAFNDANITKLDLSDNKISTIPASIKYLPKLRLLNLENNNINDLPKELLKLTNLVEINLKGNPMKNLSVNIAVAMKDKLILDKKYILSYPEAIYCTVDNKFLPSTKLKITSIWNHNTVFQDTEHVPNVEVGSLTFPADNDRKGLNITTCVLFVDIRQSVKMNDEHHLDTLAKIYSSFIYSVLDIANNCGGYIRNIIGDRIMVVFDSKNCCINAVKCAAMIMSIAKDVISKMISSGSFDCGIGIHYGMMHVIKVGLEKHGMENNANKNLVWLGEPANLASRLTDIAGKNIRGQLLPHILISQSVMNYLKGECFENNFYFVNKKYFKDINFAVYGCNLYAQE